MKNIVFFFVSFSILTSFITRTYGDSGILARVVFADLFGAASIAFFILSGQKLLTGTSLQAALIVVIAFSAGIFATKVLDATLIELLILLFLILSFRIIYSLYRSEDGFIKLIKLIIYTSLLASFTGFYGFIAGITGLPNIFAERATGEILSGFRDAGQAGAYALIMLTILMPLRSSTLNKKLNKQSLVLLNITIISLILFLFLTGKIAAYIGFAFCLFFNALQKRRLGSVLLIAIIAGSISIVWYKLKNISPDVYNRISSKYENRITDNVSGKNDITETGFFAENLGASINVFLNHPLTGSGIGAFFPIYDRHEVHSTYFKLLGETGIIGTIAYIYFLLIFFSHFKDVSRIKKKNPYANYLWNMIPFILGCFISWAYTYHLRKREFWILFAVICIASYLKKLWNVTQNQISV